MLTRSTPLIFLLMISTSILNAQTINVANTLVENGKLNAVIAILAVILLGIFIFLFYLERKIKKLEQEVKN